LRGAESGRLLERRAVAEVEGTGALGEVTARPGAVANSAPEARPGEGRVGPIHHHGGHQASHLALDAMTGHHVAQSPRNHVPDASLRLGHAHIERHLGDAVVLLARRMLHEDVAHLRPVAVPDYQIVTFADKRDDRLDGVKRIRRLLVDSTSLIATQQRVATQRNHSRSRHSCNDSA